MHLTIKFIVAISAIIILSYGFLFYQTSALQDQLVMEQAGQQARILFKQILLTRQWIADHEGLFLIKTAGVDENPYLRDSTIVTNDGTVFVKRNPAMVTRELSEYAAQAGFSWFRLISLKPVNPANSPDEVERKALESFQQGVAEVDLVADGPEGRVHRYIAPLIVQEPCLACHAEHGYKKGDIRGGLSISVPLAWADDVIHKNNMTILRYAVFSVLAVSVALIYLFNKLVARRINRLFKAMAAYPGKKYAISDDRHLIDDEIGRLISGFGDLCRRLDQAGNELDETRRQAFYNEKMASLGQLTAGIAHEINNPLGGLLNCLKTMQEEPDNKELHQRYMLLLDKGLHRIEHIMHQLLKFGRKAPLTYCRTNIDEIITECFDLLGYRLKDIELHLDLHLREQYFVDVEALRQIIVNTGLNAIQAMPGGGTLHVATRITAGRIIIRITDSGSGIDPAIKDKIFDPFFTTKEIGEGTGLGLSVSYALVKQMGGTIEVASESGQGSTFTFSLPANQENMQPSDQDGFV